MSIDELLDTMDDMLENAMQMPFSGKKSLIDVYKMGELIKEVRLNLPGEIKQAQNLVNDRKQIIADAKKEADDIIRRAEERAKQLISQEEITRLAQNKSNEIMSTAQQKSKELRMTTNEYVDNMLVRVEEVLSNDISDIKKARNALKTIK